MNDFLKMTLSPVILFVYNRPGHTQRTLEALRNNYLAEETVLYIYSDGPKHNASKEQKEKINEVRNIIRLKQWCKEVHIVESDRNKGLADSIIAGVTEIINRHGRVIVLEDDIITSRGFLRYMNEALNIYQDEEQVMHVSAYIYPHKYKTENETLFLKILSCWGWGTWARAWKYYNHSLEDHLKHFSTIDEIRKFNIHGHADYYRQLELNYNNSAYTWAVRWYASWLYAGGITLFPKTSLVENIGFDKSGENCLRPVNHFSTPVAEYIKVGKLDSISENLQVRKDIDNFYKRIQPRKLRTKVSSLAQFLKVYSLFRNAKRIISLIKNILSESTNWQIIISRAEESSFGRDVKILPTYQIYKSIIEDYSYVARNSNILNTHIGRFCSIGPNFVSGLGIHPI
ncbi:MAG: glycosyltransferase, partial [Enterococcus sp.]|nr:glycosyltransferase [Enterococcus sp.]